MYVYICMVIETSNHKELSSYDYFCRIKILTMSVHGERVGEEWCKVRLEKERQKKLSYCF